MIAVPVRSAADLMPLLPELVLVGGAFALLMLDLFLSQRHKVVTHVLATALLVLAGVLLAAGVGGQGEVFNGMFVRDTAADVLKIALCLVGVLSMVFVWPYLRDRGLWQGEVAVLMLFATAGMLLRVSAGPRRVAS